MFLDFLLLLLLGEGEVGQLLAPSKSLHRGNHMEARRVSVCGAVEGLGDLKHIWREAPKTLCSASQSQVPEMCLLAEMARAWPICSGANPDTRLA